MPAGLQSSAVSLPPLFDDPPEPFRSQLDPEAPWALLGEPLDRALAALPEDAIEIPLSPDFHLAGDRIAIGRGTRIHPGAVIEGPVFLGRGVEVRPGAYLRGGCWIGDGAVIEGAVLANGARVYKGVRLRQGSRLEPEQVAV